MTIFKTGKPPDDAREVVATGDRMGVPTRGLDKHRVNRLKALGNAIVWPIAAEIMRGMGKEEERKVEGWVTRF